MALKKLMAVLAILITALSIALIPTPVQSQQRGPAIDRIRFKVIKSPDDQVSAVLNREIDVMTGLTRPSDLETLAYAGKWISSTFGYHLCDFIFNLRPTLLSGATNPLNDVNFRHALFHLIPKAAIIGSQFRYVVGQLDTMVPQSMPEWYNGNVDPHPFSDPAILGANCESVKILEAAGYQHTGIWPNYAWTFPDGTTMPNMRVYVPTEDAAPTSYQVGYQWVAKVHAIGLDEFTLEPTEFSEYQIKMYDEWNFEVGWTCHALGRYPDYLYGMLHSSENYPGSSNPSGIYWPALDAELYTLNFGLNHVQQVAACKKAQELIAGGTPTNPLPYPYSRTGYYNWSLARLPVYSRNYYDAMQPDLRGAVNMQGQGVDITTNPWTAPGIHWSTVPAGRTDPDGKVFYVQLVEDYPEKLNILWSRTLYAEIFYQMYEGLLTINPYWGKDRPWLADSWSYAPITGDPTGAKQWVQFTLNSGVYWQDGRPFNASECKFAWDFLKNWQIPKYWYFAQYIKNVTVISPTQVKVYMYRTSQWDLYDLAATAALLPSRVWERNPITGNPWSDIIEILAFDPAQTWSGGPLPTYLYGTGPFIFRSFSLTLGYGEEDANRNYWLLTSEIESRLAYCFWRWGDVNVDGKINVFDLATIGINWGQTDVPLGPPGPDIGSYLWGTGEPDGKVDIDDLWWAGLHFGQTRTIPW